MTTPTTPAADAAIHRNIVLRLNDEADLCRNDGANDIAALLDDAAKHIQTRALEFLSAEAQADERESALVAERDAYKAMVEDVSTEVHLLRAALVYIAEESDDMVALKCAQDALAAPAVEGV